MKQRTIAIILTTPLALIATAAVAQPAPDPYEPPTTGSGATDPPKQPTTTPPTPTDPDNPFPDTSPKPDPNASSVPRGGEQPGDTYNPNKPKEKLPDHIVDMPMLITTPTGWILPAAVLYSKTAIDTGGGVTSDNRVGLGDVAEFGIATTDAVRAKTEDAERAERIQPYVTASFRLGVAENRLFSQQPGLSLGFRKSFERNHDDFKTRIAELTLVASKHIGSRVAVHVGGAFWDASLQPTTGDDRTEVTLHGTKDMPLNLGKQIRAFGGIQVEPIDRSQIMVDLGWSPEFCYACAPGDQIRLRPELSWGVRYQVADWMNLESGVRVPDIQSANLLDAQIFGSLTFTTWGLRHAVDSLK